jgi:hypothetical protein
MQYCRFIFLSHAFPLTGESLTFMRSFILRGFENIALPQVMLNTPVSLRGFMSVF